MSNHLSFTKYKHKTKTQRNAPFIGQKKNHANHYCIYDRNVKRNERGDHILTEHGTT
jgi:hypothetical protein